MHAAYVIASILGSLIDVLQDDSMHKVALVWSIASLLLVGNNWKLTVSVVYCVCNENKKVMPTAVGIQAT